MLSRSSSSGWFASELPAEVLLDREGGGKGIAMSALLSVSLVTMAFKVLMFKDGHLLALTPLPREEAVVNLSGNIGHSTRLVGQEH